MNKLKRKELLEQLLTKVCIELTNHSVSDPAFFQKNDGVKLEKIVFENLLLNAKNTIFDNTIKHIGGKNFPDITIDKSFGIEVKSTIQDHWTTIGNSVLESSRVEGVEDIYIIFGKLSLPSDFRFRKYEECLSEVVVTHYPRYKIDMNLQIGHSIFDKMGTSYDYIKNSEKPILPIVQYYKSKLNEGDSLWWVDNGDSSSQAIPLTLRLWNNLSSEEKESFIAKAMILFPQIFGNSQDKFQELQMWLITNHGVVSKSLRDVFTAGGKLTLTIRNRTFYEVPRVLFNLSSYANKILEEFIQMPQTQIQSRKTTTFDPELFARWKNRVVDNASMIYPEANDLVEFIFRT